jgi:hypothetical protein
MLLVEYPRWEDGEDGGVCPVGRKDTRARMACGEDMLDAMAADRCLLPAPHSRDSPRDT